MQKVTFILIIYICIVRFAVKGKIDDIFTSLKETQNSKEFINPKYRRHDNYINDERNSKILHDRTGKKFQVLYSKRTSNIHGILKFFINNYYKMKINNSIESIKSSLLISDSKKDHSRNLNEIGTFYTQITELFNNINTSDSNKIADLKSEHGKGNLVIRNELRSINDTIKIIQQSKDEISNLRINASSFADSISSTRNYSNINFKNTSIKPIAKFSIQGSESSKYNSSTTILLNKNMNKNTLNVTLSSSNFSYGIFSDNKISSTSPTSVHIWLSKSAVAGIVTAIIALIGFTGSAVFICIKQKCWRNNEERRPLIRQQLDNVLQN